MSGAGDRLSRWLRGAASGRRVGAALGAAYIRLCWRSTRWRVEGREHREAALARGGPVIAALWHGRLFFSPFLAPPGRRAFAMISQNKDGELISDIVAKFGIETVRGSTSDPRKQDKDKGGKQAFDDGAAALRAGGVLAITPDGPRGPSMRARRGGSALSFACGAPVLPVAFSTRRGKLLRSWDRFLLPLPFDRGVLIYGAALTPPASGGAAALEAHRRELEAALTETTRRADVGAGREPVAPK